MEHNLSLCGLADKLCLVAGSMVYNIGEKFQRLDIAWKQLLCYYNMKNAVIYCLIEYQKILDLSTVYAIIKMFVKRAVLTKEDLAGESHS